MVHVIAVLLVAANPTSEVVESDGVRIDVSVRSAVYTWRVANLDAKPITRFQVGQRGGYDFKAPEGWTMETAADRCTAWTTTPETAIRPGQSGAFSLRVSSSGGVLGQVPLTVEFSAGDPVEFTSVWGPQPEPTQTILIVVACVLLIVVAHVFILTRSDRGTPKAYANGP